MALRPARFLAPLALPGTVGAVMLVINAQQHDGSKKSTSDSHPVTASSQGHARKRPKHRFYVVKAGDVLSGIADRTGISLARIERLNPDIDAQSLQAGQRIKLVP